MKKAFNKTGFILLTVYVSMLIVLLLAGMFIDSDAPYYYNVTSGWAVAMCVLIPLTVHKTLLCNLPQKTVNAKAVCKYFSERPEKNGTTIDFFISFELPDSSAQKTFEVGIKAFRSIANNDVGKLTFKERGKKRIFIDFVK